MEAVEKAWRAEFPITERSIYLNNCSLTPLHRRGRERVERLRRQARRADLKLKERALDRTAVTEQQLGRYQPSDTVLDFLDSLAAPEYD